MQAARAAQVLPRLVPTIRVFAPDYGMLRVVNVGPGPAIDVDAELRLEPGEWAKRWTASVIVSGQHEDFYPHADGESSKPILRLTPMAETYQHFRIVGSCKDTTGTRHEVDERFDMREWWTFTTESGHAFEEDWAKKSAGQLEKIAKELHRWNSDRSHDRANAAHRMARQEGLWTRERTEARLRAKVKGITRRLRAIVAQP